MNAFKKTILAASIAAASIFSGTAVAAPFNSFTVDPVGPYANFAGRDASRGLACGSFDEDMLTKDLDGPLDTLQDLDDDQMEAMRGWEERFEEKYLVVGKLVPVGSPEAETAKAQS